MKKIIIIIVLLLSSLFYAVSANYTMVGVNDTDGRVIVDNDIQKALFASEGSNVDTFEVFACEGIYTRLSTRYYGDDEKIKVNETYPMYINEGQAIKLLSGNESLITNDFNFVRGYSNLVLNEGLAFNTDYTRSDFNQYILVHLSNNLYVNTVEYKVKTFMKEYTIPAYSIIYFTPDYINYYEFKGNDTFVFNTIKGVDNDTILTIDGEEISYLDFMVSIGEITIYHDKEAEEKQKEEEDINGDENENGKGNSGDNGNASGTAEASKDDGSHGNKKDRPAHNEAAKAPEEADVAAEPSIQPAQPSYDIVIPDWQLPTVKVVKQVEPGVYTSRTTLDIDDPAGVIYGGLVFEVLDDEGKIYKRQTFTAYSDSAYLALVNGLKPEREYYLTATYKVIDEYGIPYTFEGEDKKLTDTFVLFEKVKFKTKPASELGDIVFTKFNADQIYGNQLAIEDISFKPESDLDAVGSLNRVQFRVLKGDEVIDSGVLNQKLLNTLTQLKAIAYTARNNIESNSEYVFELKCFDMFGNELNVKNNTITVKTCKKLPVTTLVVEHVKDDKGKELISEVKITNTFENPDNVEYTNLRLYIACSDGTMYQYYDASQGRFLDYIDVNPNETITIPGLKEDKQYTVSLECTTDVGDGFGVMRRELSSKSFNTSPISILGSIAINVSNISKNVCDAERYKRAVFNISLSTSTNKQLQDYTEALSLTLTSEKGNLTYNFTQEEINKLFNNETLTIDTANIKPYVLTGNTNYKIQFTAYHILNEETGDSVKINTTPSLKQFTTTRTPVLVDMPTPETAPGYLNINVRLEDIDEVINGKNAILKIYEVNGDSKPLIASFAIEKNTIDYQNILLSSNSAYSTDGATYNIKQGFKYIFQFIAEEANIETGSALNYKFAETSIVIENGVEGRIFLNGLNQYKYGTTHNLPDQYIEVEYVMDSTDGKQFIDTGIKPTNTLGVEVTLQTNRSSGERIFFGASETTAYASGYNFAMEVSSGNAPLVCYGKNSTISGSNNTFNTSKVVKYAFNLNGNGKIQIDGKDVKEFTNKTPNLPNYTCYLFNRNIAGTISTSYYFNGKIYECKMFEGETLIRHYIPCYDVRNNKYGMYDLVTEKFYGNGGSGAFTGGKFILDSQTSTEAPTDRYLATMDIDLYFPVNWQGNNDFFVDVFDGKNPVLVNNEITANNSLHFKFIDNEQYDSGEKIKYYLIESTEDCDTNGQVISLIYNEVTGYFNGSFNYVVNKNDTQDKNKLKEQKYTFELYTRLSKGDQSKIPLYSASFTTENIIYTISNMDEFFAIKTNNRKYVVIADLFYDQPSARSNTGGNWGSSRFYAQVDFQGFSLTSSSYNPLIYYMDPAGKIENLVYKTHAKLRRNTSLGYQGNNNRGAGILVDNNYGTLSNIYVEYSEDQPEDLSTSGFIYKGTTYWSDQTDYADETTHRYAYLHTHGSLVINNYGTVENFVVDVQTPYTTAGQDGMVVVSNYGNVRNGYTFSSTGTDYKATLNVYRNSSYGSSAYNYYYSSLICGLTATTGNYIGVTENVFALGNAFNYTGLDHTGFALIDGYNTSVVRNTFANGDVTTNRTANKSYGPAVGYTTSSINRNVNINYMSSYTYSNSYNFATGILALRSADWVGDVLNVNYNQFRVKEMTDVGCYPQVILSGVMPTQKLLELPSLPNRDDVDVTFTEIYKFGTEGLTDPKQIEEKEDLDAILNAARSGNTLGDRIDGGDGEFKSNSEILVAYVQDKTASQVHSFEMSDPTIVTNVIYQHMEGTGVSAVYMEVYNPTQALSNYLINGIYFKTYAGSKQLPAIPVSRYLSAEFFNIIDEIDEWSGVQSRPTENFRLDIDLDFHGRTMDKIFVNAQFKGVLDGAGHTISNVDYDPAAYKNIYKSANQYYTGLFKEVDGKVRDLTLDNVNFEGGGYCGGLAGYANGALIENVYVLNSYVAGQNKAGGLFGFATYCDIDSSGVANTKVVTVGGEYSNYSYAPEPAVGGFVGFVDVASNITRCFASEVYVESFAKDIDASSAGGFIGSIWSGGNYCEGIYATGIVNSNAFASGGLIGLNNNSFTLKNAYEDVDVTSYWQQAAGLIGVVYTAPNYTTLLAFGDVMSGIILPEDNDVDKPNTTFSMSSNNVALTNYLYFDQSKLRANSTISRDASKSFSSELINSETIYEYLSSDYFAIDEKANEGMLPKLILKDGSLMPNQIDVNIGGGQQDKIKVSITENSNDKITVTIDRDNTTKINKIYFDYTFANDTGINTLTRHRSMSPTYEMSSTSTTTTYVITGLTNYNNLNAYTDYYRITAIEYENYDGTKHLYRINYRLNNLKEQYRTINNITDWNNYVSGSIAENFKISGDIDFANETLKYYDETNTNLIINRLIGQKKFDGASYLDKKNNPANEPYYAIKNISYESYNEYSQNHGMIYNFDSSFIKVILSDIENLTFENNYLARPGTLGLISHLQFKGKNLVFVNNTVDNKATNLACWGTGLIAYLRGNLENIYLEDNYVEARVQAAGVLVGLSRNGIYYKGISNVYANNNKFSKQVGYAGSAIITGYINGSYSFKGGTFYLNDITVENSTVNSSGGGYASAVCANIYGNANVTLNRNYVNSCDIYCNSSYVGGLFGYNQISTRFYTFDSYVYNTRVRGGSYTGGIGGVYSGYSTNNTVENCTIIGLGNVSYVGGAFGSAHYGYSEANRDPDLSVATYTTEDPISYDSWVKNTKVYGHYGVGGFTGLNYRATSGYVVENCEIIGNQRVGGIAGMSDSAIANGYVKDSVVTVWKDSAQASEFGCYYTADRTYIGGIVGMTYNGGSVFATMVENTMIGALEAIRCGGIAGEIESSNSDNKVYNCSSENCVVIGREAVGGIAGTTYPQSAGAKITVMNCYSNAYLYGGSDVGGLVGRVSSYKDTTTSIYNGYTGFANVYFTGAINSDTNASAVFGKILGNSDPTFAQLMNVSSFPKYIKAKTIYPIICDYNGADQVWDMNFIRGLKDNMKVSLYDKTELYYLDENGDITSKSTMAKLLTDNLYKDLVATKAEVLANYSLSVAGDSFIMSYSDSEDIRNNFYTYSYIDTYTTTPHNTTKRAGYTPITNDYMPRYYYPLIAKASLTDNYICYTGNDYHSLKNPFTNEYCIVTDVTQGVYIPGSTNYDSEFEYMSNIFELFRTGGYQATGLGVYLDSSYKTSTFADLFTTYKSLPSGYTQVESLTSTGTQYIVTDYCHKNNTWIDMDVVFPSIFNYNTVIGAATSDNSSDSMTFGVYNSSYINADFGKSIQFSAGMKANTRYNIKFDNVNVIINGKNYSTSGVHNSCSYPIAIFTRNLKNNNFKSEIGKATFYGIRIYEGTMGSTSSVLKAEFVPCIEDESGEYGLYDLVGDKFYKNKGTGKFTIGNVVLPSYEIDKYFTIYPSAVDELNIDTNTVLFDLIDSLNITDAKYSVYVGTDPLLVDHPISTNNRTVTFKYDYRNNLKVTLKYTYNDKIVECSKDNFIVNDSNTIANKISIVSSTTEPVSHNIFYISNGLLYRNDTLVSDSFRPVNIYEDKVLNSSGSVYYLNNINSSISFISTNEVKTTTTPLYTLTYNGKNVSTYGTYSIIDGTISNIFNLYKKDGDLIAIQRNLNPVANPVYYNTRNGKTIILVLSKDGKVNSIGTKDVLGQFNSFVNSDIKAISTNLSTCASSSNNYIGFEYNDGSILIYSIDSEKPINDLTKQPLMTSRPKLTTFLKNSFSSMLSFSPSVEEHSDDAQKAEDIIDFLDETGYSLDDLINVISNDESKVEEVANALSNNNTSLLEQEIQINLNLDELENEDVTVNPHEEGQAHEGDIDKIDELIEDINEAIENSEQKEGIITDKDTSDKREYISVYNCETDSFDILDVDELLEDPENVEKDDSRIVDKSALKSLYSAMGEKEDNTTKRGLVLYSIIAVVIILLLIPTFFLRRKTN